MAAVHDFGYLELAGNNAAYLCLKFIEGTDLYAWQASLPKEPQSTTRCLDIFLQLAQTLTVVHSTHFVGDLGFSESTVLHGDIKPSNVLVRTHNHAPVLVDFMIPDLQRLLVQKPHSAWRKRDGKYHTHFAVSEAYGTPEYMSPEQAVDGVVTPTSDIYSLGVTMEQLFFPDVPSDQPIFHVSLEGNELSASVGANETKRLTPTLERAIADLIFKMQKAEPLDRPQTAQEVVEEIEKIRLIPSER